MIIKGPGITGEVPLGRYILSVIDSSLRLGLALTVILYLLPLWNILPWWSGFAGGLAIAVWVYGDRAIPDE